MRLRSRDNIVIKLRLKLSEFKHLTFFIHACRNSASVYAFLSAIGGGNFRARPDLCT